MNASRTITRTSWLLLFLAVAFVVFSGGRGPAPAHAIAVPATYTVVQAPASADMQPGDAVTFTMSFATGATAASFLYLEGNLGSALSVASFTGGLGPTNCTASGANNQDFSCNLGSLGANTAITPITVNATVRNVADGTTIDLPASAFKAKDGQADPGVSPASDDAGLLTVRNENVQVTLTPALAEIYEAGLVNISVGLANTGGGATGSFGANLAVSGGTVTNVVCPGGGPGTGSGTTTAGCTGISIAASPSPSQTMTVTVKAANNTGAGTLGATASLSAGIYASLGSMTPLSVHELTLTGAASASVNAPVTVCTTNAPANPALVAGYPSTLNPLAAGDYVLTPAGGASVSGVAVATTCPAGQQGVTFTSTASGTVSVVARTNAPGTSTAVVGESNTVSVTFGGGSTATQLAFTASPASAVVGTAFSTTPVVAVRDSGGTLVSGDDSTQVTLSLASAPAGAVLTCTGGNTRTASGGLATFNGCSVSTAGAGYVLRATAAGLTQADSSSFAAATHGPAAKLGFLAQPAGTSAGSPLTTQPVVAVQDAGGATVVSDSTTTVTLSVQSGPGTLSCTTNNTRTVSAGVATFSGCTVSSPGTYVLRATSTPAYTPADSTSFNTSSAATKLAFTTQPGNGVAGAALSAQPVVAVRTASDATVTSDGTTQVTLAISGGATLTCTGGLTKQVSAGVATFAGCSVTPAGEGYTLTATSSPVLTSATSTAFNVTAAAPASSAQLVVATPAAGTSVPRSRLAFTVSDGTLLPTAVKLIIKRTSDNKYWNATTGAWEANAVQNAATGSDGSWKLEVTGVARRQFVGTTVTVEVRATVGATTYVNATIPSIAIR